MIRGLIRTVVIVVVLVAAAAFLLGWWGARKGVDIDSPRDVVGTTGERPKVDTERAREVGADVGERTAAAADQAQRALNDGSLTTKIKAKMALDDTIKAFDINIDTRDHVVTLRGVVKSEEQRQRALQLARETAGVSQVVDQLQVRQ